MKERPVIDRPWRDPRRDACPANQVPRDVLSYHGRGDNHAAPFRVIPFGSSKQQTQQTGDEANSTNPYALALIYSWAPRSKRE